MLKTSKTRFKLSPMMSQTQISSISEAEILKQFLDFVESEPFPCVGAKAALAQKSVVSRVYQELGSEISVNALHLDIMEYIDDLKLDDPRVQSFVAIFKDDQDMDEIRFENLLWRTLSQLYKLDLLLEMEWHPSVSKQPEKNDFSMSVAGHPFFVIGMHPKSSRRARQAPYPTLVFNSHIQFEKLRADGRFEEMKTKIRERDKALNGSINPMLEDYGHASEARQYSGRQVPPDWKCPFHP
ncbi:guanitoxin biosynthesis heme-dependent pre-guanitoxin N-hydroxylase GntA [Hirschia litorea]|uniref:Guanitoxin biosynthesis heme-dependent pre-guanitoxin N-hydroxylase GntA n=1 Tax=Hirschia litorea TaxID=1199156 RepID=A0ABW2IP22_9PROT